jgi:hypothetical protein
VVAKCYTPFDLVKEHKTLELSSKNVDIYNKKSKFDGQKSFKHCYGMLHSLSKSITIKAPSELKVKSDGEKWSYDSCNPFFASLESHDEDPHFDHGDCFITKISLPWQIEEKTGAKFLYSRHIQNTTFMNIPSGVVDFKYRHGPNIFNYIPRLNISYDVDFMHPLMSLHLLEDKKLVVETYVDSQKFFFLSEQAGAQAFFNANRVKLDKIDAAQKAKKFCPFPIGEKC